MILDNTVFLQIKFVVAWEISMFVVLRGKLSVKDPNKTFPLICCSAKTCLDTRLTKITDYESSIKTKIDGYVENFHKYLFAILEKNVVYYRTLLDRVHGRHRKCLQILRWFSDVQLNAIVTMLLDTGEGFEKDKTDAVVLLYRKKEEKKVDDIVKEYSEKVGEYKLKLVRYYRCSYRCYLSTSCLRFYKKYYYRTW